MRSVWMLTCLLTCVASLHADGPSDNVVDKVRPIPPKGIVVAEDDAIALKTGLMNLEREIRKLQVGLKDKPALLELLPDVQVYYNAVHYALTFQEFFNPKEIGFAKNLLRQGLERARQLEEGQAPWTTTTGLVVRGYVSKIDGSAQPYGLEVPKTYQPASGRQHRLDAWFHGRGETLSEVNFIQQRQTAMGQFPQRDAFVLHPYGRYCNANKFAGEVDLFEALAHVRRHYPIDDDRIAVRGFSMGGAACWQYAVHYAGLWAAAAPGAGFSETPAFLNVFQSENVQPTWYEQKLWHLYDCTDWAANLFQCPTVAYSGEKDRQKQAADMMAKALAAEGMHMVHIIGPKMGHAYDPESKKEIDRRMDSILAKGRDPVPAQVRFTTWTLRYNRMLWVTVDGLEQHWERARVDARLGNGISGVVVNTRNVSALTLAMPAGLCPLDNTRPPQVTLDGQPLEAAPVLSDRSWSAHFRKEGNKWRSAASADDGTLRKRHGLQGPIDDAFMDSFLMVKPTGQPWHEETGKWANAEMNHAIRHWRQQFRGDARTKEDREITDEDIARHNLVLWGDPGSNRLMARILSRLPIHWDPQSVRIAVKSYPSDQNMPVLVYPNPLNPKRYVVLNSGFTYREYDYLNNARQVPKLPDYTVVDVTAPMSSRFPGNVVDAGFFGEKWEVTSAP